MWGTERNIGASERIPSSVRGVNREHEGERRERGFAPLEFLAWLLRCVVVVVFGMENRALSGTQRHDRRRCRVGLGGSLAVVPGEPQSQKRGGQAHVFGRGLSSERKRIGRDMSQTPDFAVLLAAVRGLWRSGEASSIIRAAGKDGVGGLAIDAKHPQVFVRQ